MKKSFLGLASVVPALMFAACSDDGSSTPAAQDPNAGLITSSGSVQIPTDPNNPNIPVVNSSASNQPVVVPNPEENIADQPISEDEKKDDGASSVGSLKISVAGVAEVGPFASGATVTVSSVDAKTMTVGAAAVNTKTTTALGNYTASGSLTSAIGSFEASGKFFNFSLPDFSNVKSLKAISDLRNRNTVNINILTHLEYGRVQTLVAQQGLSFTAAKERAEKEVLAAFGFKSDSTMFEDISVYHMTDAAASLLALTDAMESNPSLLDDLLKLTADDIAADGKLDENAVKALIGDAAFNMDVNMNISYLSAANNDADISTYTMQKRYLWGAMFNLGSCTDANLNEVKNNNNPNSTIQDKHFICKDGGWAEASAAAVKSAEVAKTAGACDASTAGKVVSYTDGNQYICKKNLWSVATADDIAASQITVACNSSNERGVATASGSSFVCLNGVWTKAAHAAIDYSKGRAMNKKLGRGINFGNSWDAPGSDDGGWGNRISDGDFATVKAAGFNSVRIPVRWYTGMSSKLSGVKEDVQLAIKAGLTVIINNHHNQPVYDAANNGSFDSKLNDFKSEWKQVAQAFESFPDDAIVFEIFNEPHDPMSNAQVNKLMSAGYETIRSISKGKTIMFEGNGYAKFAQIQNLDLPADGNIIVSGHYYDPYSFTHQGHGDSYPCNANAKDGISNMAGNFKSYADSAARYYPDVNGGSVPMNMGEFGVANKGQCSSISDSKREAWVDAVVAQAEKYDMSWQYWCFKNCGGFEASNGGSWHGNMLNVFKKYFK